MAELHTRHLNCLSWLAFFFDFHLVASQSLPTVDLGYRVHRAISYNVNLSALATMHDSAEN